jgi:hypothetical protein
MVFGEVEDSRSTVDDGREHLEGMLGGLFGAGFGGGVDDVGKVAVVEGKTADVAGNEGQGFVGCQVRAFPREGSGVTSENCRVRIEAKVPVDVGKTFEQPTAEEASAACNEDALVSHFVPERPRLAEDVVEIGGGQRLQCHRIGLTILADVDVVWLGRTGKQRLGRVSMRILLFGTRDFLSVVPQFESIWFVLYECSRVAGGLGQCMVSRDLGKGELADGVG